MSTHWYRCLYVEKIAESSGHWRTLKPGQKGHDQAGLEVPGKTWVHRSRMKKWFVPYKHQKSFVEKVVRLPKGGGVIAAHGTGTGKTISSIAAFEKLKDQGRAKRALVITPAGIRTNFLQGGVQKFTESKGVIVSNANQTVGEDVEYVITSYAAFRRNPDAFLAKYHPDTIIADEMHRAVNEGSSTHIALKRARSKVDTFMGLTASSSQNDPSDIAALNAIASRERNPTTSREAFKKRYQRNRVTKGRGMFGGKSAPETVLIRQNEIAHYLGKTIHYLEDLDASKKPTKVATNVPVEMSSLQVKIYKQTMKGIDPKIQAKIQAGEPVTQKEASSIFKRILDARRVSNSLHQHVPGMTLKQAANATPKIRKILRDAQTHIKNNDDAQIIIYTNLVAGGVDVIAAGLEDRKISYGVFSGARKDVGVTKESRQQAVEDYKAGKIKVLVITAAGAEGLDLGNTTLVQVADPHYNPERTAQAEARGIRAEGLSHRPQERRKVEVRRYVSKIPKNFWQTITFSSAPKGIDEWVYNTAARKARATRQLRNVLDRRREQ